MYALFTTACNVLFTDNVKYNRNKNKIILNAKAKYLKSIRVLLSFIEIQYPIWDYIDPKKKGIVRIRG